MTPNSNWVTTDLLGRHNLHEDHYRSEAVITKLPSNEIIMRTIQYGNWREKVIVTLVMKIAQHPKAKLFCLHLLGTRPDTILRDPPNRQLICLAK